MKHVSNMMIFLVTGQDFICYEWKWLTSLYPMEAQGIFRLIVGVRRHRGLADGLNGSL